MGTNDFSREFITFAREVGVLRFGEFMTKSGRCSPYFFNAGAFCSGATFARLCDFYARAIVASGVDFDMLYGPAYKGIALAAGSAAALTARTKGERDIAFCYNRKEAKDHGEGGHLIGAPLSGRVFIVDDVITAGLSVRESVDIIKAAGAYPVAVVIAMDRQERGEGACSAVQDVERRYGIPVISVAKLEDLISTLVDEGTCTQHLSAIKAYRSRYGIA
jgi:orotate phosphoribosyltransferase